MKLVPAIILAFLVIACSSDPAPCGKEASIPEEAPAAREAPPERKETPTGTEAVKPPPDLPAELTRKQPDKVARPSEPDAPLVDPDAAIVGSWVLAKARIMGEEAPEARGTLVVEAGRTFRSTFREKPDRNDNTGTGAWRLEGNILVLDPTIREGRKVQDEQERFKLSFPDRDTLILANADAATLEEANDVLTWKRNAE